MSDISGPVGNWVQLKNSKKDIFSGKFYCFSRQLIMFDQYLQRMFKSGDQEEILLRRAQQGDFYGYLYKTQRNHVIATTCLHHHLHP